MYDLSLDRPSFLRHITPFHQCAYLPEHSARLEFIELPIPNSMATAEFSQFSREGFRRSGEHLYRPICGYCQRCITTRVPVNDYHLNRTQRKLWRKCAGLEVKLTPCEAATELHFSLYARYICARHSDSDMYPPSLDSFQRFLQFSFTDSFFMEFWEKNELIMVAVCDELDDGLSAVYTFFAPEYTSCSLGTLAILHQINYIKSLGLPYVYLGFWVPGSEKMAYKTNFHPIELLIDGQWRRFEQAVTPAMVEPLLQQAVKAYYLSAWQQGHSILK